MQASGVPTPNLGQVDDFGRPLGAAGMMGAANSRALFGYGNGQISEQWERFPNRGFQAGLPLQPGYPYQQLRDNGFARNRAAPPQQWERGQGF